ncbi:MAG: bifunctional 4-hydroxy-2-oxoglutarate aldolase/2-dehydro-3-deoxy-phosphogluconate aldolase [Acidimicrobiia bacterium]|nr:bifunctional 4-hydroxy-2-oxoglutarate aldolase/2-dehydro-3-deoxy-phosphogluconate aldolase [Acidimicrobiia bacterium]
MRSEASLASVRRSGVVPLLSSSDPGVLWQAANAVVDAGFEVIEVALREPGVLPALERLIERIDRAGLPLTVGAGTVLDVASASAAIDAGAGFVFSPVLSPEVGVRCGSDAVAWFPGCATPTEVRTALELGCDAVKLFPADLIGGPRFLRALRSVLGDLPAIPSGGIDPRSGDLADWFEAGAVAVGAGSSLFPGAAIASGDWDEIGRRLVAAAQAVASARRGEAE